jgi:hypothetical protein
MSITHLIHKGEETALEAFGDACQRISVDACDGFVCDDLEAARDVLRAPEEGMAEAQAAIRGKESRRSL